MSNIETIHSQEEHDQVDATVVLLGNVDPYSNEALAYCQQIIKQYDSVEYEQTSKVIELQHAIIRNQHAMGKYAVGSAPWADVRNELIRFTRELACHLWCLARNDGAYPRILGTD